MPRLSDTMEEGTVAKWLKKVGDTVNEGDILAEIETDKATMEFEAFEAGTLLYIGINEGESASVDSLLAIIGNKGENVEKIIKNQTANKTEVPPLTPPPMPQKKEEIVAEKISVVETEQKVVEHKQTTTNNKKVIASPLAKKIAKEKGINLTQIKGTGDNERIIKRDLENYNAQKGGMRTFMPSGVESTEIIPNSKMRKTVAKRLSISKFSAPHYYLSVEFDMDKTISFRSQFNAIPDTKISFNDIIVKATALALKNHPEVNCQWQEDTIIRNKHVHIGVAVAVEDGLVVPVIKFVDEQNLNQIGAQVKDFAARAKSKKLTPAEMEGSTFTISNLGMFNITEFTSIINAPNAAILSVGAITQKPVVKEGKIVVGNTMKLTLACDHRSVDGVTGAQFLQTLREYIENPILLLV